MTTPLDQTRAEFEAHRMEKTGRVPETWADFCEYEGTLAPGSAIGEIYVNSDDQAAWEAWQAAIASRWQPIETAPRDGTAVLVISMGAPQPAPEIAFWADGNFCDGYPDEWEARAMRGMRAWHDLATHWQPLPAPPTPQDPPTAAKAAKETPQ